MKGNVNGTPFRASTRVVATPLAEQHCELIERSSLGST